MEFPDWDWLSYTTGDIGVVLDIQKYSQTHIVLRVFFITRQLESKIPEFYVEKIKE
tara:strand:+ start:613 stop:780 length:168 start_codon:yes stop_codon:yes gene_type:complete